MSDITSNSNGGQSDPYEREGNEELEKKIETEKPNGEQDRIDEEEARIADEPEKEEESSESGS
jgi:hypothetical protein